MLACAVGWFVTTTPLAAADRFVATTGIDGANLTATGPCRTIGQPIRRAAAGLRADHSDIGLRVTRDGTFDDRGGNVSVDPRPSGAGCDIGADEFVP